MSVEDEIHLASPLSLIDLQRSCFQESSSLESKKQAISIPPCSIAVAYMLLVWDFKLAVLNSKYPFAHITPLTSKEH